MDPDPSFLELLGIVMFLAFIWVGLLLVLSALLACDPSDTLRRVPAMIDAGVIDGGHLCRDIFEPGWGVRCCRAPTRPNISVVCWEPHDAGG